MANDIGNVNSKWEMLMLKFNMIERFLKGIFRFCDKKIPLGNKNSKNLPNSKRTANSRKLIQIKAKKKSTN